MLRRALTAMFMSALLSVAHAQNTTPAAQPGATGAPGSTPGQPAQPATDPDPGRVTDIDCTKWRAKLSKGQKLAPEELGRFISCIPDIE
jgi:hypothetical protein